ncbi:hypothetical protein E4U23_008659 [Claviceps purpurea]|nr:hypothetical protein E4U23_008659 [Claviceps purpurea]
MAWQTRPDNRARRHTQAPRRLGPTIIVWAHSGKDQDPPLALDGLFIKETLRAEWRERWNKQREAARARRAKCEPTAAEHEPSFEPSFEPNKKVMRLHRDL